MFPNDSTQCGEGHMAERCAIKGRPTFFLSKTKNVISTYESQRMGSAVKVIIER